MADIIEYYSLNWFKVPELQKTVFPSTESITKINIDSLRKLDKVRDMLKEPIVINCSYRSRDWDIRKGRPGTSSHCKGRAFDIRVTDKTYRLRLIYAALSCGFTRVGVYPTFVHLDDDVSKSPCMWITDKQL